MRINCCTSQAGEGFQVRGSNCVMKLAEVSATLGASVHGVALCYVASGLQMNIVKPRQMYSRLIDC